MSTSPIDPVLDRLHQEISLLAPAVRTAIARLRYRYLAAWMGRNEYDLIATNLLLVLLQIDVLPGTGDLSDATTVWTDYVDRVTAGKARKPARELVAATRKIFATTGFRRLGLVRLLRTCSPTASAATAGVRRAQEFLYQFAADVLARQSLSAESDQTALATLGKLLELEGAGAALQLAASSPNWPSLLDDPSPVAVVAALRQEIAPLAPALAHALALQMAAQSTWANYGPHDLLAVDLAYIHGALSLADGTADPKETEVLQPVVQELAAHLRYPQADLTRIAWQTIHNDPWSWPYTARLLQHTAQVQEADAVRAWLFACACLLATADRTLMDDERSGLEALYQRLYGDQTALPGWVDDLDLAPNPAEVQPAPHTTWEMQLYGFARHHLEQLAPQVAAKITGEYPDLEQNRGYRLILQDLIYAVQRVWQADDPAWEDHTLVGDVLNRLALDYGLGDLPSLSQKAQAGERWRSLVQITASDRQTAAPLTEQLQTLILTFAEVAAQDGGLTVNEDHVVDQIKSEVEVVLAQARMVAEAASMPQIPEPASPPADTISVASMSEAVKTTAELDACLAELNSLIGLASVKKNVTTMLSFLQVQQARRQIGLAEADTTLHLVFKGNPGTGKTTVARLLARIYRAIGLLQTGQFVEVDRAELIGEYLGHTAPKMEKVVSQALGGVLFIDEAYALFNSGRDDPYGQEAVASLLKLMEDHKKELVVIVAGYPAPMDEFLASNPGFKSRFTEELIFEDYRPEELFAIFRRFCTESEYAFTGDAGRALTQIFQTAYVNRDERNFGNARFARNLFDDILHSHASRIARQPSPTWRTLSTIEAEDVMPFLVSHAQPSGAA